EGVHYVLAGGLAYDIESLERPLSHVVLESLRGEARIGIDPGDDEYCESLLDAPFDEGFFRREVENIIFVDPRRDDQKRTPQDLLGRWCILDELHQIVLVDHLAG